MAERQIVDLVVEGSSPFFHPMRVQQHCWTFSLAPVAQLDRASDFESAGCRFEPCQAQCFSITVSDFQNYLLLFLTRFLKNSMRSAEKAPSSILHVQFTPLHVDG